MKPKLLMICLLRSSASALATHPRGGGGIGVGLASGSNSRRGLFPSARSRNVATTTTRDESSSSSCTTESSSSTSLHVTNIHEDAPHVISSSNNKNKTPLLSSGHIAFRLARRTDVPQIQNCNLATLPENYNANFYVNHMRTWPELTLVAEHIPEGCDRTTDDGDDSDKITPVSEYLRRKKQQLNQPKKEIVGYVLGKVEERPFNPPQRQIFPPARVPLYNNNDEEETLLQYMNNGNNNGVRFPSNRRQYQQRQRQQPRVPTEKIGHVTSLAVHTHARRLGIASSLMSQLHYHLEECYGANSIGLHVRVSNQAAVKLYCEEGYDVADIIPLYYGDGEDAYFMRKDIGSTVSEEIPLQQQQQQPQRQWRRGERERNEMLNRDATRTGSFFDGRKSMRETLSEEERAWVNSNGNNQNNNNYNPQNARNLSTSSAPSLSGQFKRSFRTLFNGGEQQMQQQQQQQLRRQQNNNQFTLPPWEDGPEGLRLPRYCRVVRPSPPMPEVVPAAASSTSTVSSRVGMSLNDLVSKQEEVADEVYDDIESCYEEEEDDVLALDARV